MKSITCHNERKLLAGTDPGSRRYCTSYICLLLPTWYCAPGEGDLKDLICVQEVCIVRGHRCARSWPHFEVGSVAWVISPTLSLHCHCHDITPVKTMTLPSIVGSFHVSIPPFPPLLYPKDSAKPLGTTLLL